MAVCYNVLNAVKSTVLCETPRSLTCLQQEQEHTDAPQSIMVWLQKRDSDVSAVSLAG